MDENRFDALTQGIWQNKTRRRVLRRLVVLPLGAAFGAFLTGPHELAAEHPVRRIQDRKDKQRERRRKRLKHQRDVEQRDNGVGNGLGSGECQETKGGGESCQQNCQCVEKYRCGEPRPTAERATCRQAPDAKQVCCLGKEYDCAVTCQCCGGLSCTNHVCTDRPPAEPPVPG